MQEIKQQLEDLAFAVLHPKRYAEIEQMVLEPRPEREIDLRAGDRRGVGPPGRAPHPGEGHRPAEAPLLHLREDGGEGQGVRRDQRPRRRARDRRLRQGLLRRARLDPRDWRPGAGAVQGLRGDAQVQPLPVVAHDGDRSAGQAGRVPDPHRGDAPAGRVRRRRALGVQGGEQPRRGPRVAAPAGRHATGDERPGRVPGHPEVDLEPGRGLRLHAEGAGRRPCRRARRRSTSPTRSTPRSGTAASARASTGGWCPSTRRCTRATRARSSPRKVEGAGRAGTGSSSSRRPGRARRSGSGSRASGGTTRSTPAGRS
ncbi:MAG: hypothetical protein KatS3mg009_2476 [Acidimicrobiia bacterium]|nr:MAG: hypothetical protein KatS3mg009_2476 [Acidimicrobiia bacterium]